MSIWKLEPTDLDSHHWAASTYKRPVVIRAADEKAARGIASRAFWIGTSKPPGKEVSSIPWRQVRLTPCTKLEGSDFSEEGPDAILEPAEYDNEWRS